MSISNNELYDSEYENNIISNMKEKANKYNLWIEVKNSYDDYRKSGDTPEKAAFCALYDWDL